MSDYLLASDEEKSRLRLQALTWEHEAAQMLERIGIQPGWRCLEVGCGAMGILKLLSESVGLEGRVIGVDSDKSLLEAARAYVEEEQLQNVEILEQDVEQLDFATHSFDFAHERFVLPYVDPELVLRKMIELVRPNGIVASQEPDQYSWQYYPGSPTWERLKAIIEAGFALRGDINIGRKTYGMLRRLGLENVSTRAAVLALQNRHPYMRLPVLGVNAMRRHLIPAGISTDEQLNELLAEVDRWVDDPETLNITFTLVQIWGRKPQG